MAIFFGSTTKINDAINALVAERAESHWKAMNDSSVDSQKKRIEDIMQRIWPKAAPSLFDRFFNFMCERSDALNQRWDRMHDRFFETWNHGAEKTGMTFLTTKFIYWHRDPSPDSREEAISALFNERRPWWDFFGWVTKGRVEKVEATLDAHISQTKIKQFAPVKEVVAKMLKRDMEPNAGIPAALRDWAAKTPKRDMGPNEIVKRLRDHKPKPGSPEYDVSYFSDDELYLMTHLALKGEELIPKSGPNPAKSWSEWKFAGLEKLFGRAHSDLEKLKPGELDRLNREFKVSPAHWEAQKTLWEFGRSGVPKQLSNPLLRAAMRCEKNELWNCFPMEMKERLKRVATSAVYRQVVDLDLSIQLQKRLREQLQKMQDEGDLRAYVPAFQKELAEMLASGLFSERFGDEFVKTKPLEGKKGGRDMAFHVQIDTARHKPLSFLVSLEIPKDGSRKFPEVQVKRGEIKDFVRNKPALSLWARLTRSSRDRAFEEIFSEFENGETRGATLKKQYLSALDVFEDVADKKKGGDSSNLLSGLNLPFAKLAFGGVDHECLLGMKETLEELLLATDAKLALDRKRKGVAKSEDVEAALKEFEAVHALLKQLCKIKSYEETFEGITLEEKRLLEKLPAMQRQVEEKRLLEEKRLPAMQRQVEEAFAAMQELLQTNPLESMMEGKEGKRSSEKTPPPLESTKEKEPLQRIPLESKEDKDLRRQQFRSSLEPIESRFNAIESEMKKWNLEVLEVANPELAKRAGEMLAEFEKQKGVFQQELLPYRMILMKESMDEALKVLDEVQEAYGWVETRINKIRKEFPLETKIQEKGDADLLSKQIDFLELERGFLLDYYARYPGLSVIIGSLMSEVDQLESEIEAYRLVLDKFKGDTFAQEEAEEISGAPFGPGTR